MLGCIYYVGPKDHSEDHIPQRTEGHHSQRPSEMQWWGGSDVTKNSVPVLLCPLVLTVGQAVTESSSFIAMVRMGSRNSRGQVVAHNCPAEAPLRQERYTRDEAEAGPERVWAAWGGGPGSRVPSLVAPMLALWFMPPGHVEGLAWPTEARGGRLPLVWKWIGSECEWKLKINGGCITVSFRGDFEGQWWEKNLYDG